jgi:hypothetical protein
MSVDRTSSALYLPEDCRAMVQSYLGSACWNRRFSTIVADLVNAGCPGQHVGYLVHCYLESGRLEFGLGETQPVQPETCEE